MEQDRSPAEITVWAPAKLNLSFDALVKRPDGYHEIETLMVPIGLYDRLRFRARADGELRLTCRWDTPEIRERRAAQAGARADAESPDNALPADDALPAEADNLAYRALRLLAERAGVSRGAEVELVKRIPAAAGLGGGSSDAAAALAAGNRGWGLDWPIARLAELAAEIGSDVPFFLFGGAAICRGRGERIEPCRRLAPAWIVVVKPPAGLSTAAVYRHCQPAVREPDATSGSESLASALARGDWRMGRPWIGNRLEAAAARVSPWPGRLRQAFADADCVAAQLCGSGSGYFGVCRHARHARRMARRLAARRLGRVFVMTS